MSTSTSEMPCVAGKAFIHGDVVVDPFPEMRAWQERGPVQEVNFGQVFYGDDAGRTFDPMGHRSFTALTFDAVTKLVNDPERFSSTITHDMFYGNFGRSLLELDPPEHTRERSLVALAFRPRALDEWNESAVRPLARETAARLRGKNSAELVSEFCLHFPMRVIAKILGMPDDFLPQFERWAFEIFAGNAEAAQELKEYCQGVIELKRSNPGSDVVSTLVKAEIDGERLDNDQILAFMRLLFPAGGETTFRAIGNLIWCLIKHPEQLEAVQRDRSLVNAAIEESLRWQPVTACISPRGTMMDVTEYGVFMPANSLVHMAYGAANRDPMRWRDPDVFDVKRAQLPHTTFSGGPHQCLGLHLARLEIKEAIEALLDVITDLRFDPDEPEPHLHGLSLRVPCALPVVYKAV